MCTAGAPYVYASFKVASLAFHQVQSELGPSVQTAGSVLGSDHEAWEKKTLQKLIQVAPM